MRGRHVAVQSKSIHHGKLQNCRECNKIQCKGCGSPFTLSTALEFYKDYCSIRCEDPALFRKMQHTGHGGVGRGALGAGL